jgi:hypothetical protein
LIDHYDILQKRLVITYDDLRDEKEHTVAFDVTLKEHMEDMDEPGF